MDTLEDLVLQLIDMREELARRTELEKAKQVEIQVATAWQTGEPLAFLVGRQLVSIQADGIVNIEAIPNWEDFG